MVEEARMEELEGGRTAVTDGWFVVNVRDAAWMTNEHFGTACVFEGDAVQFAEIGYTIGVLQPGQTGGLYHQEANQEDFLVLAGECVALVEGQERRLKAWDFLHCPAGTEHIFVGAGHGPCVIFMSGARAHAGQIVYPRSDLALRHGAGVEAETTSPREAYAPFPKWRNGRPDTWRGLPWDEEREP